MKADSRRTHLRDCVSRPDGSLHLHLAEELVNLLPERAAFWGARRTLIVADLHWGKAELFQQHGVPVSSRSLEPDFARLAHLVNRFQAKRILVLGDLVHDGRAICGSLVDDICHLRRLIPAEVWLVPGNHDAHMEALPSSWNIHVAPARLDEPPFSFVHVPPTDAGEKDLFWAGHLHPCVVLKGQGDRIRAPCFFFKNRTFHLPAFGSFTGGMNVRLRQTSALFVVTDTHVLPLS